MASGVAVVGALSGEIPNVVGDAGVLFAENNPVALREELATLVGDAAARRQLAHRGRQRVLQLFTQKAVAAKTLAFYHQVLGP
jgi:glycosyltransferase involved in cell wall biosynthesis